MNLGDPVNPSPASSITDVLETLRISASSSRDLGDSFERLVQAAFKTDRTYRERFTDVWLWTEWPDRRGNLTPNDWATEHGNPRYIFDLVGQVISVSMQTRDIIDGLPSLEL